jgi:hypothetical protein
MPRRDKREPPRTLVIKSRERQGRRMPFCNIIFKEKRYRTEILWEPRELLRCGAGKKKHERAGFASRATENEFAKAVVRATLAT